MDAQFGDEGKEHRRRQHHGFHRHRKDESPQSADERTHRAPWPGGEEPDERTVDAHIRRLRRRLGEYASVVRTMRGSGYRYDTHPDVTVWSATARR